MKQSHDGFTLLELTLFLVLSGVCMLFAGRYVIVAEAQVQEEQSLILRMSEIESGVSALQSDLDAWALGEGFEPDQMSFGDLEVGVNVLEFDTVVRSRRVKCRYTLSQDKPGERVRMQRGRITEQDGNPTVVDTETLTLLPEGEWRFQLVEDSGVKRVELVRQRPDGSGTVVWRTTLGSIRNCSQRLL